MYIICHQTENNYQSIKNKIEGLYNPIKSSGRRIIMKTEMRLNRNIHGAELFSLKYDIHFNPVFFYHSW